MSSEAEWKETWYLFDEKRSGQVSKSDFIHIVRSLGRKYTEVEIQEKTSHLGDVVKLEEFVKFMSEPYEGPTEQDLLTALQAFDGNETGYLKHSEIVSLLTTLGEKMSEAEVKQLMAEVKTDDQGRVSIAEFAKYLTEPVPTMTPNIEELQKQLA
ncbi:Calmodulin [Diplonema papillatum]|nr:Calmodulin [Diplonema papillatum]|eukprot:gene10583-16280_t